MIEPSLLECRRYWEKVAPRAINTTTKQAAANWGKIHREIRFLLDYEVSRTRQILEIGPGSGFIPATLKVMCGGLRYIGLDLSNHFCRALRQLWGLRTIQGHVAEMPFKDGSFEWVFAFDSLEHIRPQDRQAAWGEIGRVMFPYGMLFVNNPVTSGFHDKSFDYFLYDKDIGELAETINARVVRMDLYEVKQFQYQFIVLQKDGS